MPHLKLRAAVLLAASLSLSFSLDSSVAADAGTVDLQGSWEGFIAETPARLTLISLNLTRNPDGWQGMVDLPGAGNLPLNTVRVSGPSLHLELLVGDASVIFEATLEGETLTGQVREGDSTYGLQMNRIPDYPPPGDRVAAWRQDLDVARSRFLRYDRSFDPPSRAAFLAALSHLESSLQELNDSQIIVELSAAVALSGNAHTRLYLLRNRTELSRLPLRVHWFSEGLFVVRATGPARPALGCRVLSLAGRDPGRVRKQVARLFAGNPAWVDYKSPYFMTSPEILHGLGLVADPGRVPMSFACPDGTTLRLHLASLPLQRSRTASEDWRTLSPRWQWDGLEWDSLLPPDEDLPLYLRHPELHYWFQELPAEKALYMQYNRSQDMEEGDGFSAFADKVVEVVGRRPVEKFILDLRFNTGGNNGIAAPFMEKLAALESRGGIAHLFVITGRATFSAGISHAADLRQNSRATFVGEPVGDELDTWSEGGNIVLPNSGLTLHFTNGFHSLSRTPHPEFREFLWSDMDLESLDPHLPVSPSYADYAAGRDPALAAILGIPRAGETSTRP